MDDNELNHEISDELVRLKTKFMAALPAKIDQLEQRIRAIPDHPEETCEAGQPLTASLQHAYDAAHRLAGSAGSYGLVTVSNAANLLQHLINHWFESEHDNAADKKDELLGLVQLMRDIPESGKTLALPKQPKQVHRKICIVDDDEDNAQLMQQWLKEAGFDTEIFLSAVVFADLYVQLPPPDLILMDIRFGLEHDAGTRIIGFLKEQLGHLPPVVFISVADDINSRLQALRAGAARYLTKPVTREGIVALAREFSDPEHEPQFRVLMVDDDEETLALNRVLLEQAGFEVKTLAEPLDSLEVARDFDPDVILLDIHMPRIKGTEIAAILREDLRFDAVPIIFLTSDTHPDQKSLGVSLGGDELLTKPFDFHYLVTSLLSRARRSRRLRRLLRKPRLA